MAPMHHGRAELTLPTIAMGAGTRGMMGAGLGLLLAERVPAARRRRVGWTLFLLGALSTIPLAYRIWNASPRGAASIDPTGVPRL